MDDGTRRGTHAHDAVFTPLNDLGRAEQVEQRLAEAIRSGVLTRGERLPNEPDLAARFGVAVVTVREALTGLRSRGLVQTRRGRGGGTVVSAEPGSGDDALTRRLAAMSRAELQDRMTLYSLLLSGCAELAAERADPSDGASLRDLLPSAQAEAGTWRHADAELWLSVAALTQSARTTREVVRVEADLGSLVRIPLGEQLFRERTLASHHRLIDAIGDGDPATARAVARAQLRDVLARLARTQAALHDATSEGDRAREPRRAP